MDATKIVNEVIETGRKVAKRDTQRFPEAASIGDFCRQGDVLIVLIGWLPDGAREIPCPSQLAPGDTPGSRHILDSTRGITAYSRPNPTEFDGPILRVTEEREVQHPEHGWWVLPAGLYSVRYQRTQDALDQARRVQD